MRNVPDRDNSMASNHFSPNRDLDVMYSSLIRLLSQKWKRTYLSSYENKDGIAYEPLFKGVLWKYSNNNKRKYSTLSKTMSVSYSRSSIEDPINRTSRATKLD